MGMSDKTAWTIMPEPYLHSSFVSCLSYRTCPNPMTFSGGSMASEASSRRTKFDIIVTVWPCMHHKLQCLSISMSNGHNRSHSIEGQGARLSSKNSCHHLKELKILKGNTNTDFGQNSVLCKLLKFAYRHKLRNSQECENRAKVLKECL